MINSWASGPAHFPRADARPDDLRGGGPRIPAGHLYADGDYDGKEFHAFDVAGSDQNYVFGGFRAKNREFIDSLKSGKEVTTSPFRDTVKTMEVCETILAQALLSGT